MSEIRFNTSDPATPANDPAKPVAGATMTDDKTLQITPQPPKVEPKAEPKGDERPAWLPDKFKSAEDLAKAYAELEKAKAAPAADPAKTPAAPKAEALDFTIITKEYAEKGAISEATLTALEAKGIPRAMVSSYVAGQQALVAQQTATLSADIGGPDVLKSTLEWAGKNATAAEIAGYNALIDAGNLDAAKVLLGSMHAKYVEAVGQDPTLVNGGTGGGSASVGGYKSSAEMVRDMSDKRYAEDPAFRSMVEQRVNLSKF